MPLLCPPVGPGIPVQWCQESHSMQQGSAQKQHGTSQCTLAAFFAGCSLRSAVSHFWHGTWWYLICLQHIWTTKSGSVCFWFVWPTVWAPLCMQLAWEPQLAMKPTLSWPWMMRLIVVLIMLCSSGPSKVWQSPRHFHTMTIHNSQVHHRKWDNMLVLLLLFRRKSSSLQEMA